MLIEIISLQIIFIWQNQFYSENFGLITFRETAMLYESGVSAIGKKMTVAAVICHEIAHQVSEAFFFLPSTLNYL